MLTEKKPSDFPPSSMFQPTNFNMDWGYKEKLLCNFSRPNSRPNQEISPLVGAYHEGAHASEIKEQKKYKNFRKTTIIPSEDPSEYLEENSIKTPFNDQNYGRDLIPSIENN